MKNDIFLYLEFCFRLDYVDEEEVQGTKLQGYSTAGSTGYNTSAVPSYSTAAPASYGTTAAPSYSAPVAQSYTTTAASKYSTTAANYSSTAATSYSAAATNYSSPSGSNYPATAGPSQTADLRTAPPGMNTNQHNSGISIISFLYCVIVKIEKDKYYGNFLDLKFLFSLN